MGIAVKDGSKLKLSNYKLLNNEYDLAVFNKKKEYDSSLLNISDPIEDNKLKFLILSKTNIIKDNIISLNLVLTIASKLFTGRKPPEEIKDNDKLKEIKALMSAKDRMINITTVKNK